MTELVFLSLDSSLKMKIVIIYLYINRATMKMIISTVYIFISLLVVMMHFKNKSEFYFFTSSAHKWKIEMNLFKLLNIVSPELPYIMTFMYFFDFTVRTYWFRLQPSNHQQQFNHILIKS